MKPTMTLHETCEIYRANVMHMSEGKLSRAIKENKYPEWSMPLYGKGGRFMPEIYTAKFVEWFKDKYGITEVKGI